jgi:excisionase family DNA binding protein
VNPLTISVEEFCRLVGVGRTLAFSLLKAGEIVRVKCGRRTLVRLDSVERYVDRCTVPASGLGDQENAEAVSELRPTGRRK